VLGGARRNRKRAAAALAAITVTTAALAAVVHAQVGGRGEPAARELDQVTVALRRRALVGDAPRLTRDRLFYSKIAYRDLVVRVNGRRGPWAARYRQVIRRWVAANGSARLLYRVGGATTLVGPRDRARWRADGSPSLTESAGRVSEVDYGIGRFVGGNLQATHLTYRDLLALPTEEAALSAHLGTIVPRAAGASLERAKVEAIAELLGANPAPPALRAALYDVLSKLRGLELEGIRVDPVGRLVVGRSLAEATGKTVLGQAGA
jgi:hypothetical protein